MSYAQRLQTLWQSCVKIIKIPFFASFVWFLIKYLEHICIWNFQNFINTFLSSTHRKFGTVTLLHLKNAIFCRFFICMTNFNCKVIKYSHNCYDIPRQLICSIAKKNTTKVENRNTLLLLSYEKVHTCDGM